MSQRPTVSVILSSYNHGRYLRAAIDSVLGQSYQDFELIVWDDASTDDSWSVVQAYSDPRIQSVRDPENRVTRSLNAAIRLKSAGRYIAIHHSDDIWEPSKLAEQVACLDARPEVGAVFSKARIIGTNGELLPAESTAYQTIFDQPNRSRHEWLRYFFYRSNALCHPSVLFRRSCFEHTGPYDERLLQLDDLDMWVRICLSWDIHVIQDPLVQFRVDSAGTSVSAPTPQAHTRMAFETSVVLSRYRQLSTVAELARVFPRAARFGRPDGGDAEFALAMVALEAAPYRPRELFGLMLLFEIFADPVRAERIEAMYGFRHRDLIALTGKHSVLGGNR